MGFGEGKIKISTFSLNYRDYSRFVIFKLFSHVIFGLKTFYADFSNIFKNICFQCFACIVPVPIINMDEYPIFQTSNLTFSNFAKETVIRWCFSCAEVNNKEPEHLQLKFWCFCFASNVCGGVRGGAKPSEATERTTLQFPVLILMFCNYMMLCI